MAEASGGTIANFVQKLGGGGQMTPVRVGPRQGHNAADRAIDRLNDLQQRDLPRIAIESVSAVAAQTAAQDAGPGQGLEDLQRAIGGNAQVVGHVPRLDRSGTFLLAEKRGRECSLSRCFA